MVDSSYAERKYDEQIPLRKFDADSGSAKILYRLKPDNDWALFKTTGPPQQKVDSHGYRMYEQWPTDRARPRALLDFEVLPDRVSVFLIQGVSQADHLEDREPGTLYVQFGVFPSPFCSIFLNPNRSPGAIERF